VRFGFAAAHWNIFFKRVTKTHAKHAQIAATAKAPGHCIGSRFWADEMMVMAD
jgi:hypothetical protein